MSAGNAENPQMPDSRAHRATLLALCVVPFIMVLGNSLLIPVLPELQKALEVRLARIGILITLFSVPAGLVIPFSGMLSDRVGRKAVMVPALILYGSGGIVAGLASVLAPHPWPWILAGRVLQGIGAGGTYQLAMAMAGDLYPGPERSGALGLLEAANGLGKVVAPLAGAAVALITWYAPFFLYGLLALPAAALVWWGAKEPPEPPQRSSLGRYWQTLGTIGRKKGTSFLITGFAGFFVLGNLFGSLSLVSDLLEREHGLGVFTRGLLLAIPVLVMTVVAYTIGTAAQAHLVRWVRWTVPAGLLLSGAGLAALLLFDSWGARLAAVSAGVGLGTGLTLPSVNVLVTSTASRTERGIVTGIYGSMRFFGVAAGPPLFGLASDHGRTALLFLAVGLLVLLAWLQVVVVRHEVLLPPALQQQGGQPGGH